MVTRENGELLGGVTVGNAVFEKSVVVGVLTKEGGGVPVIEIPREGVVGDVMVGVDPIKGDKERGEVALSGSGDSKGDIAVARCPFDRGEFPEIPPKDVPLNKVVGEVSGVFGVFTPNVDDFGTFGVVV